MALENTFSPSTSGTGTPGGFSTLRSEEIQERLRKQYLMRLSQRLRRLRKDLVDRNWQIIRSECKQLSSSGESFGFPELTAMAARVEILIPEGEKSRAKGLPEAKDAVENLIFKMDQILLESGLSVQKL